MILCKVEVRSIHCDSPEILSFTPCMIERLLFSLELRFGSVGSQASIIKNYD